MTSMAFIGYIYLRGLWDSIGITAYPSYLL
jgi:hypothetical protein